jgi:hypothetical protein
VSSFGKISLDEETVGFDCKRSEILRVVLEGLNQLDLKDESKRVARLVHLADLELTLKDLVSNLELREDLKWNTGHAAGSNTINRAYVSMDFPTPDEVKRVRQTLNAAGFTLERHSSDAEYQRELYYLKNDAMLQCWYPTWSAQHAGATCKYVKVGEKTVDVMELRCDD